MKSFKIILLGAFILINTSIFAQSTTPFGSYADPMEDTPAKKTATTDKAQKTTAQKDVKKLPTTKGTKPKTVATETKKKEEIR